jgi:conjugal transfer/entry exclusion protein
MRIAAVGLSLALTLALGGSAARSGTTDCDEASSQYKSVLHDVRDALHAYGNCLSNSRGHDDCALEFSTLQSAQGDFEAAVANYPDNCS